jgi:hypothetical protein
MSMLVKPCLANCYNRNQKAKTHPTSGGPDDWFGNDVLKSFDLLGISFDFFVNWAAKPSSLTPVIWVKAVLHSGYFYTDVTKDADGCLQSYFGEGYLSTLCRFARNNKLELQFVIFKDELDWNSPNSEVLLLIADTRRETIADSKRLNIADFKRLIRNYSGGPVHVGQKGLILGTSRLECFLSRTDSAYPGDVDLIIVDKDAMPVCILEFKKVTQAKDIATECLSTYYPHPDGRKYNRLAILRDYLSAEVPKVPVIVVYYPTRDDATHGKMELLNGDEGNLLTNASGMFLLPTEQTKAAYQSINNKLHKAIKYHYKDAK